MKSYLTEENVQMVYKYMKRGQASVGIREMQIKTLMRHQHNTCFRIAKIKRVTIPTAN